MPFGAKCKQLQFQSAHLLKKSGPEIVKTSAEETKDSNLVNGNHRDDVSVKSTDTGATESREVGSEAGESKCDKEEIKQEDATKREEVQDDNRQSSEEREPADPTTPIPQTGWISLFFVDHGSGTWEIPIRNPVCFPGL